MVPATATDWDRPSRYLRDTRRCTTLRQLAVYTIGHLQAATGADWSECLLTNRRGELRVVATIDQDLTDELMNARMATGEPPAPTAMIDQTVSITDFNAGDSPWPVFAAEATRVTPLRSAVLPYFATTEGAGVLTISGSRPGQFGPVERTYVRLIADLFALMLGRIEMSVRDQQLHLAIESGRLVGAATGMLAARRCITTDAAFALLKTSSQHSNRKLRILAEEVLRAGDL